jgi:hypothetical protein
MVTSIFSEGDINCHSHCVSQFFIAVTNTWEKQFKGGKTYFGQCFRGCSPGSAASTAVGRCSEAEHHRSWEAEGDRQKGVMARYSSQGPALVTYFPQQPLPPKVSTTSQSRATSWGPSVQPPRLWRAFHIQTTTPIILGSSSVRNGWYPGVFSFPKLLGIKLVFL